MGPLADINSFAPSRLHEKNNIGIVTEKLRDFFRFLELRGVRLNEPGKKPFFLPFRPVELPADFPQIIRGHFRDLDPKILLNDLLTIFAETKSARSTFNPSLRL